MTSKLVYLVERIGTKASPQERNHFLACCYAHRDIHDGKIQTEDLDTRSVCVLCAHTLVTIDRGDWNRTT